MFNKAPSPITAQQSNPRAVFITQKCIWIHTPIISSLPHSFSHRLWTRSLANRFLGCFEVFLFVWVTAATWTLTMKPLCKTGKVGGWVCVCVCVCATQNSVLHHAVSLSLSVCLSFVCLPVSSSLGLWVVFLQLSALVFPPFCLCLTRSLVLSLHPAFEHVVRAVCLWGAKCNLAC